MKINIPELNKKSELTFEGKQSIELRKINPNRKVIDCEVSVNGTATKTGNRYLVSGQILAKVPLVCDRCLDEYEHTLQVDLYKVYSSEKVFDEDEEIIQVTGDVIDLEDAITEAVYLNVPMQGLHDENCKGICKTCGQNLNHHTCDCSSEEIDPRLEALNSIFHPQSEE